MSPSLFLIPYSIRPKLCLQLSRIMASTRQSSSTTLPIGCYDTALCIIPPRRLWPSIDNLRSHYDKAYRKWPPHINLIYPFVQVDALPRAVEAIQSAVSSVQGPRSITIRLDAAGVFPHRRDNTIYLHDADDDPYQQLKHLRRSILEALGQESAADIKIHLTIGQTEQKNESWHNFLLQKAGFLPRVEWEVEQLCILVREKSEHGNSTLSSEMVPWSIVSLADGKATQPTATQSLHDLFAREVEETERLCFAHDDSGVWKPCKSGQAPTLKHDDLSTTAIATYNVLAEFHYPPSPQRYPLIVRNLLSESAKADVVVLQEVTDDFLSYLLQRQDVRDAFRFCSHGPPNQDDIDPLPSHNNIAILSNYTFHWRNLPFEREHKTAIIAEFSKLGQLDDSEMAPVVLAAVHLTHGLKNGAITARKNEVEKLLAYLGREYVDNPILLAGDFNLTTSSFSIKEALKQNTITTQSAFCHSELEKMLMNEGFVDTWTSFQLEKGLVSEDDLEPAFEGEQGATYDPTVNFLARETFRSGFNMRPQRYDRILIKGGQFTVVRANQFGKITEQVETEDKDPRTLFASDHWGIRTILRLSSEFKSDSHSPANTTICHVKEAEGSLADEEQILTALQDSGALPSIDEACSRTAVFELLKTVIVEFSPPNAPIIVVPVGSYGLGVWTASSDIDCLCIGPLSSTTFFSLAAQRLRKSSDKGVKILRWVKAHSGTMMELDIQGTKIDLQYASAHTIAENWPDALKLPGSHPIWALSSQSLSKLKSIRDIDYIARSVPDLVKFRVAHRLIRTWAKKRGIYTTKYGYLGGIQIAVLLIRVCKMLVRQNAGLSVADVLITFFNHYAHFNWKDDLVFDPFFHKNLSYRRTDREPLAILGYFPPPLNTTLNASIPTVRAISEEFRRADELLSADDAMTWSKFLGVDGSADFLRSFKSFIRIDVQFWGGSLTKGRGFVGWVESRCVSLLVDLQKRLPHLYPRIWPARFVEKSEDSDTQQGDADNYQGSYLIGLDKLKQDMTADEEKIMHGTLLSILGRFETQIRTDDKYFDEKTSWMSASIAKATELKEMEIDAREWGEFALGDDELDEELEDDEGNEQSSATTWGSPGEVDHQQEAIPWHLKKDPKPRTNSPRSATVPKPEGAGKFRTAADVLNRLRWDPSMDSGDYIVGYEDRFVGAMERGLEAWKSEQTDEEFIPQHRILYFKRKSDQVIVWERRTRTDLLFGSG